MAPDLLRQRLNERLARDAQTDTQIIPESHAKLGTGLGEAAEGIAAIAPCIAAGSDADFATDHLTTDVVLGAVGMQWDFRPLQHPQQLGLVGMEPLQQSIQCDEAGAAEDAIESGTYRETTAFAGIGPIP